MNQITAKPLTMGITDTVNNEDYLSPFKGPFKGKGKNNKVVAEMRASLSEIESEMKVVLEEFQMFRPKKFPVNMCIFKPRGIPQLWWREYGVKSKYLKLFESKSGTIILRNMLPATTRLLIDFERSRLHYNLQAKMHGQAIENYRRYRKGNDIIDEQLDKLDAQ